MAKESFIRMGRVLHEDDDFITLEVAKSLSREIDVQKNDRNYSLTFVRAAKGRAVQWLPWKPKAK